MKISNVLFLGAGLVLAANVPAFADGDGDGSGSATVGAGAEVGAGGASAGAGADVSAGGGATTAAWPQEVLNRTYTLPASKIAAYADIGVIHLSLTTPLGSASATGETLTLGGAYGINEKITVGAQYYFPFAGDFDPKGKGPLTFFGMFSLAHTDKLTVAATADFELNLGAGTDAMGNSITTKTIHAGLGLKYLLAPKIAIFTGSPVGPGPVGQHLSISLESSGPIDFAIPVGVGLQATPQLFAYAATNFATIHIANKAMGADSATFIGTDAGGIPLTLGGLFSVNKNLDAGAALIFPDLKHAGDLWGVALTGRWYN
ncbi:MAG: hypothetical protein JWO36_3189 [Myxococcales bacterium]|nr:hypothetical protein [Myxococcales bacterium]